MSSDKSNQLLIRETIRKVALGRSMERINLTPGGMSGIGTARMIHGYVAKVHNNLPDEEFSDYGGTIDANEYPDGTASAEPAIHKGVLLSAATNSGGGFLIVPVLFSDVTILMDTATRYACMINFSHMDILRLNAHTEAVTGVTEMEELDPENDPSPNYDELETTGNEASTHYMPTTITTTVRNGEDREVITVIDAEDITRTVDKSEVRQTADKMVRKVNSTTVATVNNKVTLGGENATGPLVLSNELARLVFDFLTECSKIMAPTLMDMMSPISIPNFISLTSHIQKFLSKTSYTK